MAVGADLDMRQGVSGDVPTVLLGVRDLDKNYGPIKAVSGVSFTLRRGEALALCGENGAGKSTVFKVLAGEVGADGGEIHIDGARYAPSSPAKAVSLGVSMVHQEFNILPNVTVAENVFVGRMNAFRRFGRVDWRRLYEEADALLKRLRLSIDPRQTMSALSPSAQKMVELARALSTHPRVLLLDEITASLDHDDADTMHAAVERLREEGVAIVYVSHRLQEIFRTCETVCILKDGAEVATLPTAELDEQKLSALMVGRDLQNWARPVATIDPEVAFKVEGISGEGFEDISLEVRHGQTVTLAGLAGSGADEILEAIFGARPISRGAMEIEGEVFAPIDVAAAVGKGVGMVPKERAVEGLIDALDIRTNIGLANLPNLKRGIVLDRGKERSLAEEGFRTFQIKARDASTAVRELSGGNKQKVLLAKWFAIGPRLILLNNPTRGVDVGVKFEIYELLKSLREKNRLAVLMASEDMAEVVRISDVVFTIRHGRISGRFEGAEITETNLINAML
ncbi:MAG: sugar ABC transporter ATP-binding protein [Bauldia sp.]|uniref:sugar ABC transporter ATP-binding protein n=1 Tax=Bauldia sp. TaxID=2575872 RepID=UPI001DFFF9F5|nr:sugar ABC transporter ATP-binding protein [Bauldia sp.]MCB1496259.1 sugar ABC transporter ATP-binding protein [Bauldia sp.]